MEKTMQASPMIRLEGVTKVFYTDELETHALDGINLDVAKGEFLSIAGPSGCGKSTLRAPTCATSGSVSSSRPST
jgi:putative ABC transport system ATP-binding protein